jgi:neutral amino acid transport system ATP-binding protein
VPADAPPPDSTSASSGNPSGVTAASGAHTAASGPILSVRGVHRSFGGVVAVSVDEFHVDHGSIVALIGPNGAGKTTFFNVLTGFERADGGSWHFEGEDLSGNHAYAIARAGMVRTFQTARVFPRLSVLDNVRLGATKQQGERLTRSLLRWSWRQQEKDLGDRAAEIVEWVGLGEKKDDLAGTLSGGQRKLLELARAVMAKPSLLMLDEPMAGVNPALRQSLLDRIRELADDGITVLFVEHDMDVVSSIAERVVCMAEGEIIASGTPGEVAASEAVIEAYLGASSADLRDVPRAQVPDVADSSDGAASADGADEIDRPAGGTPSDGGDHGG